MSTLSLTPFAPLDVFSTLSRSRSCSVAPFLPATESLFQLKFTAKSLQRQSKKASKDEIAEKAKLKKALAQGNSEGARIYAANAIRKSNESLNLLRLASRIDGVASRVETAVTMRQVTGGMTSVVKGMDKAMESMNIDRISMVMDRFEGQFNEMDAQTNYMESAMNSSVSQTTPQDQVDLLMAKVADENGIEFNRKMGEVALDGKPLDNLKAQEQEASAAKAGAEGNTEQPEESDALEQRLKALRPAT